MECFPSYLAIGDVAKGEPDQLDGGIVIWEVTSVLDDLAQLHVPSLHR